MDRHKGKKYYLKMHPSSGPECSIYTVGVYEITDSLFNRFVIENSTHSSVLDVIKRLKAIGSVTGAEDSSFKFEQWKYDDRICYLYAEPHDLRLYCIWINEKILIIGGGGAKHVAAWQDDEKLKEEVIWMIQISKDIRERIANGELFVSPFGLTGNLKFNH